MSWLEKSGVAATEALGWVDLFILVRLAQKIVFSVLLSFFRQRSDFSSPHILIQDEGTKTFDKIWSKSFDNNDFFLIEKM